jgi:hypothetical protein
MRSPNCAQLGTVWECRRKKLPGRVEFLKTLDTVLELTE